MSAAKRIAQVAPLYERVPPLYYGGTERIVSYLSEELERGHGVMLFASGDSITNTHLVAACESGLRLNPRTADHQACNVLQLEQVLRDADSFDVIFYIDWLHFPSCKRMGTANVTTFHGRLDLPELVLLLLEEFDACNLHFCCAAKSVAVYRQNTRP